MLSLRSASPGRPYVIGHRGASGEAPENTMSAFELAIQQGADLVECDVHPTADGELVVMHDFAVDRTTEGHGLVKDLTLAEIRALNAGARFPGFSGSERVPTLAELLDWASDKVPVAIEVKSGPIRYQGIEHRLGQAIARHNAVDRTIVISFDHAVLLRLKKLDPNIATGVLFAGAPVAASSLAMAAHADALLPHWGDLSAEMVEEAHSNLMAISTWAVDAERDMSWVVSLGVDALATNYPGRLVNLLSSRAEP